LVGSSLERWAVEYRLNTRLVALIIVAPLVIPVGYLVLLHLPGLRRLARETLQENHLIESLTFVVMFSGGVFGLWLARKVWKVGEEAWVATFYMIFSVGFLLTAMEEIAWGQSLFGFETPEYWRSINVQGETTLHNLAGIQGFRDHIKLTYALGGSLGCALTLVHVFKKISAPMMLGPWFIVIAFWTSLEILVPKQNRYWYVAESIAELTELLLAISGMLYLWLNHRLQSRGR